ncbi:MAG: nitroreductase [Firmicutes bacterium]|nr:nitroreductase [Alicyclobacillaceae bacterium]MCL6497120.1 nitroreductase [Bacillota bacterium]
MDVLEALVSRRSIGRLTGEVDPALVEQLIAYAVWAPNHHLTQPWRFTLLHGAMRAELGRLWAHLSADERGLSGEARAEWVAREAARPLRAPLLIVVSCPVDPDPVRAAEDHSATAAAVQNFLLAAWAKGLGTIWRTGAMAYHPQVKRFLGLDPTDRIVAILYVGQPAAPPPPPRPRDLGRAIRWLNPPESAPEGADPPQ